jgi:hypothetical protein
METVTHHDTRLIRASFERVKIQLYSLGLIRMEKYTEQGGGMSSNQTVCSALTEARRHALAALLAEKRPQSQTSVTA